MAQFQNTEALFIALILIASLVAILVRRLHVPYTVALVVVGLLLTRQSSLDIELTPELILGLFVPPLVFEAAFHLNFNDLRNNFPAILVLAVPGVLLTTFLVAGVLVLGIHLSLAAALVFGSLIAATDPVAVVALFRILGVPKRLAVLVEGESLFNDGTALVLFNMMVVIALTGQFSLAQGLFEFLRVSAGGLIVGIALGWAASLLIARVDDYLIETSITTVLAFGSYLLAERLQFSGVLAVVAAGLVNGNLGPRGMSPTTRIVLFNFWEYIAFVANSLVFLLIGLKVDIPIMISTWQPILWAIGAVVIARVLVVYGLGWVANQFGEPISLHWKHVLTWGGLRGALSLALALSVPAALGADRELILAMAFGVVLFTLLVQATTMKPLVAKLGIVITNPQQVEYEKRHAELTAAKAAEIHLERRYREGLISTHTWEALKPKMQEQSLRLSHAVREVLKANPTLEAKEMDIARREILRAKRSAYLGLRRDGVISEEAFGQLSTQVDAQLDEENAFPDVAVEDVQVPEGEENLEQQELVVEAGSSGDGRKVRHIPWPRDFLITRLQRGSQTLVPNGETILQAGDVLSILASDEAYHEAEKACMRPKG